MSQYDLNYGSVEDADAYFNSCLHRDGWFTCNTADRLKALVCATSIIEKLRYVGYKNALWAKIQSACGCCSKLPTKDQIMEADAVQPLKFPRGCETEVPCDVLKATYEIAYELLVECRNPSLELENLGVVSDQYDVIKTVYDRANAPPQHIANGVPSAMAWACLKPWLATTTYFRVKHTS